MDQTGLEELEGHAAETTGMVDRDDDSEAPAESETGTEENGPLWGIVLGNAVRIRADAGLESSIFGKGDAGDVVQVLETGNEWHKIRQDETDDVGWMHGDYVLVCRGKANAEGLARAYDYEPTPIFRQEPMKISCAPTVGNSLLAGLRIPPWPPWSNQRGLGRFGAAEPRSCRSKADCP